MPLLHRTALLIGIAVVTAGLALFPPWAPELGEFAIFALPRWIVALLIAALLARVLRWPFALAIAAVMLLTLTYLHGVAVMASVALLLLAGLAVGSLLVPVPQSPSRVGRSSEIVTDDSPWLAMLIGGGMLMGTMAWLLPLPIFSQRAVIIVLLIICLIRHRAIAAHLRDLGQTIAAATVEAPKAIAATFAVLWLASMPAWLPVMSSDDLASHLQIGWQLQTLGYYRMDVGSQVWSLAPWLADVHYGALQLVAGSEGVGALNSVWLAITGWLVVRLGQTIGLRGAMPWLAAMLYVSLPMVGALTMSMQTETFSAMLVAALGLLIMRASATPDRTTLLCAAGLAAMLIGSKILNLAFVGPLGLLLLWQWRGRVPWRALPSSLLLALLIGGASFTYAWLLAGNPIMPLFNGVFESPWAPIENATDLRWHRGLSLMTPFWLTFDAGSYYETSLPRGAGGVALILLGFGCLGAAADPRTRGLLLAALLAWILPLTQMQYLRYTVPALPLLLPVLLAGLAMSDWRRLVALTCASAVALQLAMLPTASWMLAAGATRTLVKQGISPLLHEFAPERAIASYWRTQRNPTDRLLIVTPYSSAHAEFAGAAFVTTWYDPTLKKVMTEEFNPADGWRKAVARSGANFLLIRRDEPPAGLHDYLIESGATLAHAVGAAWLYQLTQSTEHGEIVPAPSGHVSLRFPIDATSPRLIDATVVINCSRPFEPVGVSWVIHPPARPPKSLHMTWQYCPANGVAEIAIGVSLPSDWSPLTLEVMPVSADSAQQITLVSQQIIDRPDLARERELSVNVRNAVCRRWRMCRELDGARVLSVLR